jgi:hypothetical protein
MTKYSKGGTGNQEDIAGQLVLEWINNSQTVQQSDDNCCYSYS